MYREAEQELYQYICAQQRIDTHLHIPGFAFSLPSDTDFFMEYLRTNFNCDLISAGMPRELLLHHILVPGLSVHEKWELLEPYWRLCRHTGYARAVRASIRLLYDVDDIYSDTVATINERFIKQLGSERYNRVIKEKSKIKIALLDNEQVSCDVTLFRTVLQLNLFLKLSEGTPIARLEEKLGHPIHNLHSWLDSCIHICRLATSAGCIGFKLSASYERSLHFERTSMPQAQAEFALLKECELKKRSLPLAAVSALQSVTLHHLLQYINSIGGLLQVHTGTFEGNGNILQDSRAIHIEPLLLQYPDIRFDIFHIGYPYTCETGAMVKKYPNAYANFCWAHTLSPASATQALAQWLEMLPLNKICVVGSDNPFLDSIAGHHYLANINLAAVLGHKIHCGRLDMAAAKEIASQLLYGNPCTLYKL